MDEEDHRLLQLPLKEFLLELHAHPRKQYHTEVRRRLYQYAWSELRALESYRMQLSPYPRSKVMRMEWIEETLAAEVVKRLK